MNLADKLRNLCLRHERGELLCGISVIADEVEKLEEEIEALKFDLGNAHAGRNAEAIARCELEDRLRELSLADSIADSCYDRPPHGTDPEYWPDGES